MVINTQIQTQPDDKAFMEYMRLAFNWANEMGLKGKKVFGLLLKQPDSNNFDPVNTQSILWCQVECTKEERECWEENRKMKMEQWFCDSLRDE